MKRWLVLLLVVTLLMTPWTAVEANANKDASPPKHKFGKTLAEWQLLYFTWFLGFSPEDHVGNVGFLPLPAGEPSPENPARLVGNLDVTWAPGTAFVLPLLSYVGESYVEDIPDDPALEDECFTAASIQLSLDGRSLLDSNVDNLSDYYTGQQFFASPLIYPAPQPRDGGVNADAAVWLQAIGLVHSPLSVGEHLLSLNAVYGCSDFGFINTWKINVQSKG